jgi:hypothetical protein
MRCFVFLVLDRVEIAEIARIDPEEGGSKFL